LTPDLPDLPDLIDPRQRQAAAILLSAVTLPAPMAAWARQLSRAAQACPGIKIDQIYINDRTAALKGARALIDALLAETEQ
jgi:hypothetical protein